MLTPARRGKFKIGTRLRGPCHRARARRQTLFELPEPTSRSCLWHDCCSAKSEPQVPRLCRSATNGMRVSIPSICHQHRFRCLKARVCLLSAAGPWARAVGRWSFSASAIGLAGTLVLTAPRAAAAEAQRGSGPAITRAEIHTEAVESAPKEAHAGEATSDDSEPSATAVMHELRSFERTLAPTERIRSFSVWCLFLLALFLGRSAILRLWGRCQKAPRKPVEAGPQRKAAPKPAAPPKAPPKRPEFYRHGSTIVARRP